MSAQQEPSESLTLLNTKDAAFWVVVLETPDGLDTRFGGTYPKPVMAQVLRQIADACDGHES